MPDIFKDLPKQFENSENIKQKVALPLMKTNWPVSVPLSKVNTMSKLEAMCQKNLVQGAPVVMHITKRGEAYFNSLPQPEQQKGQKQIVHPETSLHEMVGTHSVFRGKGWECFCLLHQDISFMKWITANGEYSIYYKIEWSKFFLYWMQKIPHNKNWKKKMQLN